MIAPGAELKIYIATRPVDFRCGHDGLAAKVQEMLGLDPFSGAAFVFRSKRAERIKILVWDRTGLVLVHKRLEVRVPADRDHGFQAIVITHSRAS
ncbi:IS66 family insertion sequence element accessory protein TnpB [Bradyrhizobium barranii]|uniref:IS66 family insertion sequence element accessory protein TnpB n=1 Tax=Bradyrhizobium barranii TaxID=2992140 RepID=UPI0024AFCC94|nr:IS66 family insertion sequence element accessory protein TnpB [Bradyrhizobium barranii]WFT94297.1 IS66 family insertion sequence element accessory protein TnpB [Bradyrhizobium barranii]